MIDPKDIKAIAFQLHTLSAQLLGIIARDEEERRALIEEAKKTPSGMFSISPA